MDKIEPEKSSSGWRMLSDTRGVNRFQGRGRSVEIPSHLHAAPPEAHFERSTFYKAHFPGHNINQVDMLKPIRREDKILLSTSKVEGASVYARDYPKYPNAPPADLCPNKSNLHKQPGRVEGQTLYMSEFLEHEGACLNKTEPIVPSDNLRPTDAKFEQHSVSFADFQ